jgi:hypothetical protein
LRRTQLTLKCTNSTAWSHRYSSRSSASTGREWKRPGDGAGPASTGREFTQVHGPRVVAAAPHSRTGGGGRAPELSRVIPASPQDEGPAGGPSVGVVRPNASPDKRL